MKKTLIALLVILTSFGISACLNKEKAAKVVANTFLNQLYTVDLATKNDLGEVTSNPVFTDPTRTKEEIEKANQQRDDKILSIQNNKFKNTVTSDFLQPLIQNQLYRALFCADKNNCTVSLDKLKLTRSQPNLSDIIEFEYVADIRIKFLADNKVVASTEKGIVDMKKVNGVWKVNYTRITSGSRELNGIF